MGIHGFFPHYHVTTPQVKEFSAGFARVGHKIPCCCLMILEIMFLFCSHVLAAHVDGNGWPAARGVSASLHKRRILKEFFPSEFAIEEFQTVCKPGSVHTLGRMLDGHSSGTGFATRLGATNPGGGPETLPRPCVATRRRPPLFGLAPGGVYPASPVTRAAVRSYRTVSPLPRDEPLAVCFLWHYPWGRPRRPLAGTVFPWSPDFPPAVFTPPAAVQPSGNSATAPVPVWRQPSALNTNFAMMTAIVRSRTVVAPSSAIRICRTSNQPSFVLLSRRLIIQP